MNTVRDRRYMSAVTQLSLLNATHRRDQLATMLANTMTKREELGVPGASLDRGYEGIVSNVSSIASQTSTFDWSILTQKVEERLLSGIDNFNYNPGCYRIMPSVMFAAFNVFYTIQSLPEDRKITLSNGSGIVTFITWAHFVLGLSVVVEGRGHQVVHFKTNLRAQVIINWNVAKSERAFLETLKP